MFYPYLVSLCNWWLRQREQNLFSSSRAVLLRRFLEVWYLRSRHSVHARVIDPRGPPLAIRRLLPCTQPRERGFNYVEHIIADVPLISLDYVKDVPPDAEARP